MAVLRCFDVLAALRALAFVVPVLVWRPRVPVLFAVVAPKAPYGIFELRRHDKMGVARCAGRCAPGARTQRVLGPPRDRQRFVQRALVCPAVARRTLAHSRPLACAPFTVARTVAARQASKLQTCDEGAAPCPKQSATRDLHSCCEYRAHRVVEYSRDRAFKQPRQKKT